MRRYILIFISGFAFGIVICLIGVSQHKATSPTVVSQEPSQVIISTPTLQAIQATATREVSYYISDQWITIDLPTTWSQNPYSGEEFYIPLGSEIAVKSGYLHTYQSQCAPKLAEKYSRLTLQDLVTLRALQVR